MGKILDVPPQLPKIIVTSEGIAVKIVSAAVKQDVTTRMGKITKALTLEVEYQNNKYSYLFSIDKEQVAGSVGRILSKLAKVTDTDHLDDKALKNMLGKTVTIKNEGGKLYWYP